MILFCSGGNSGSCSSGRGYLTPVGSSVSSAGSSSSSQSVSASQASGSSWDCSTGGATVGWGTAGAGGGSRAACWSFSRQHFLYFLPLPHGQGSFLPTLISVYC